jgi:gas vesicle protein
MADRFDRIDNEASGGGSFVMGLLTGTVLGAGLGILFAPRAGAELRSQLSEQAANLATTASDGYRQATENAGQWAEKGKDMYGKAREAVKTGADEAQRYVADAASGVMGTPPTPAAGSSASTGSSGSGVSSGPKFGGGSESTRASGSDVTRSSGSASSSSTASHSGGGHSGGGHSGSTGGSRRS